MLLGGIAVDRQVEEAARPACVGRERYGLALEDAVFKQAEGHVVGAQLRELVVARPLLGHVELRGLVVVPEGSRSALVGVGRRRKRAIACIDNLDRHVHRRGVGGDAGHAARFGHLVAVGAGRIEAELLESALARTRVAVARDGLGVDRGAVGVGQREGVLPRRHYRIVSGPYRLGNRNGHLGGRDVVIDVREAHGLIGVSGRISTVGHFPGGRKLAVVILNRHRHGLFGSGVVGHAGNRAGLGHLVAVGSLALEHDRSKELGAAVVGRVGLHDLAADGIRRQRSTGR